MQKLSVIVRFFLVEVQLLICSITDGEQLVDLALTTGNITFKLVNEKKSAVGFTIQMIKR